MITGFVNGQDLRITQPVVASGTIDYLTAQFKFVSAFLWDDCDQVRSVWTKGNESYSIPLTGGKVLPSDHLNLSGGTWYVHLVGSVFAGDDVIQRITTIPAKVQVIECGVTVDIDIPFPDILTTEAERLWAKIAELEEKIAELEAGGAKKITATYNADTGELVVSGGTVAFDEDTGELTIDGTPMSFDETTGEMIIGG